jgi:hypothetical protein
MMMEREKETMSDVERKKMSEKIILYFKSCVKIKKKKTYLIAGQNLY